MTSRRLFRKDVSGVATVHDLYNKPTGHSVIQFSEIKIGIAPEGTLWLCVYQWRDGLEKLLDKLSFDDFKRKYIAGEDVIHFDPMSRVFLKLEYTDIEDFDFELSYELCVREHEPVYL